MRYPNSVGGTPKNCLKVLVVVVVVVDSGSNSSNGSSGLFSVLI